MSTSSSAARRCAIKAGFDPTAPDLHLGHTVLINKMRQFQQFGHEVMFLIGDFTGMIGDPTGRNATRPRLTPDEIKANARTYEQQIYKILDPARDAHRLQLALVRPDERRRPDRDRRAATPSRACSSATTSASASRATSRSRCTNSCIRWCRATTRWRCSADVELGGTDQKFNLLVGRQLQEHYGQEPQVVLTMPLLEGLDGVNKMSKSLGNYIGITDAPDEMFGKLMRISDELMWRYFELLSFRPLAEIAALKAAVAAGPQSARREVRAGAGDRRALPRRGARPRARRQNFTSRFADKTLPTDLPEIALECATGEAGISLVAALAGAGVGLAASRGEARRKLAEGAVRIDGEKASDPQLRAGGRPRATRCSSGRGALPGSLMQKPILNNRSDRHGTGRKCCRPLTASRPGPYNARPRQMPRRGNLAARCKRVSLC